MVKRLNASALLGILLLSMAGVICPGCSPPPKVEPHTEPESPAVDFASMALIPAGVTARGSGTGERSSIPAFLLDRFEVTVGEFRRFVRETGHTAAHPQAQILWHELFLHDLHATHPMVYVSFPDAEAYALWANKRLPTEVEWEWAAAGSRRVRYPWGYSFHRNRCNTLELGVRHTTRVGTFESGRSQDGCYDLCGNVWEWTASDFLDYPLRDDGALRGWAVRGRVIKGGGYNTLRDNAVSQNFSLEEDANFNGWLGFRCAKNVDADVVARILTMIEEDTVATRVFAAELLSGLPADVSSRKLVETLKDPSPQVVAAAYEGLIRVCQEENARLLVTRQMTISGIETDRFPGLLQIEEQDQAGEQADLNLDGDPDMGGHLIDPDLLIPLEGEVIPTESEEGI